MKLKGTEKIAILRLSALGDVVLVIPVLRCLQRAYPQLSITWIISRTFYPLVADIKGVDFIVVDKPRSLGDYWRLRKQLKPYRFDILLALQASLRANLITALIRAPIKIGYDKKRAKDGQRLFVNQRIAFARQHLVDSFLTFLEPLSILPHQWTWDIPIPDVDKQWAGRQLPMAQPPLLVVHPTASKTERNWLLDRYIAVIEHAQKTWQATIVLTGGSSEQEMRVNKSISDACPHVINLSGKTRLKQLLAVIAKADAVLAPDTSVIHIARALSIPVIGLYAVCPLEKSGPYRAYDYSIDVYPTAVKQFLQVDPKTVDWEVKVHHDEAMGLIQVAEVIAKIDQVFDKYRQTPSRQG